jgi:leucyl/phenylalanyl-tRNA--protein transferase
MPVFRLTDDIIFPPPEYAEEDGLLAVGGDLSEERLLLAYEMGIFPWFAEGSPILWWSPDPRLVLFPEEVKVSRSLKQTIRKGIYVVTMDAAFDAVIGNCAEVHRGKDGETWITQEMVDAYRKLHQSGRAHSIECWCREELVGGLYGVALGRAFFGESMFTKRTDASKVAFVKLVECLREWDFAFIDCQVTTGHLLSLGARNIPRAKFLKMLKNALRTGRQYWGAPSSPGCASQGEKRGQGKQVTP